MCAVSGIRRHFENFATVLVPPVDAVVSREVAIAAPYYDVLSVDLVLLERPRRILLHENEIF
jgi:hypothetical protein